jgi:hypothetical protein
VTPGQLLGFLSEDYSVPIPPTPPRIERINPQYYDSDMSSYYNRLDGLNLGGMIPDKPDDPSINNNTSPNNYGSPIDNYLNQ